MIEKYDHIKIEEKWSQIWEKDNIYCTPDDATSENKYYILPQLPYPSGSGLHVGHAEVYSACDIFARYKRMKGKKVLQVIGWDAFGLPAENYAIKNNVYPKVTTNDAIDNFRYQIKRMGVSVDWDREVGSHSPEYYKWTQWFFLLMYKRGLAYRKEQQVNWCPGCKTVLANEQVVDGCCERSGDKVEQKMMEQWYLKITEYADRLYDDLDKVDWPEETIKRQRDWIGRSEGINISYEVPGLDEKIKVFTTRPDTNFGATFIVCAPDSDFIIRNVEKFSEKEKVRKYMKSVKNKTELERMQEGKKKTGVFTGLYALNMLNNKRIPIYVGDFVLASVGTGNVVGVPGHDKRDFEFAKAVGAEIVRVVVGSDGDKSEITDVKKVQEAEGTMINSDFLDGLNINEATGKIMDYLVEKGWGERITNYKLRDWSVSRQRFWGAPIPMVFDQEGKPHPVPEKDLPVLLPDDVDFIPTGQSPLTYSKDFQTGVEKKYGESWRREVDTLDTFLCSSWYYYRYLDPRNDQAFASKEALEKWMPVDFYIGGPEHVTGHLLYSRFFTKVLYDAGYITFDEPFAVHRHQGTILGEDNRKMSKRWGNVINPTDVMDRNGADTLRIYEMFMGPLSDTKPWNTKGEKGVHKFLLKVWNLQKKVSESFESREQEIEINKLIKKVGEDIEDLSFNTAVAKSMEFTNFLVVEKEVKKSVWERFLKILSPFAPYMTEELWQKGGNSDSIHKEQWPEYDKKLIIEEKIIMAVQVNGKVRDKIEISAGEGQASVQKKALAQERIKKYVEGEPKKVIFVKDKIINLIV
ncbi:leucine--tRNA ligase [Candidatus Dojkabacteria bacterium]|nr:leucine--tRNA ligase [Candidatus Dojkabacteria bacterium]